MNNNSTNDVIESTNDVIESTNDVIESTNDVESLCARILKSEGGFDPFMLTSNCMTRSQDLKWRDIMLPAFLKFLNEMDSDEFIAMSKRAERFFKFDT